MSTPDAGFIEKFMAPWNAHDVDGAMALMTDDCLWEIPRGPAPHGTLFRGAAEVRSAIARAFASMPDVRYELVRSAVGEDLAVVELLVTGTPAGGAPVAYHACDVMILRDGKVAAKRSYRKLVE